MPKFAVLARLSKMTAPDVEICYDTLDPELENIGGDLERG